MRRTLALPALLGLLASGCTFGFGSPYVGQWRAHEEPEFEVCVEDASGACESTTTVMTEKPARSFWGFAMSYPMTGISFATLGDGSKTAFRMELQAEYLRGHGRFALGVRAGTVFDVSKDFFITSPVMAMGHVGLSERFSFYGGAGFSPYNSLQFDTASEEGETLRSSALGRVLAGLQIVGSSSQRESRILYSIEADAMATSLGGTSYRSWGLTASIGLFL